MGFEARARSAKGRRPEGRAMAEEKRPVKVTRENRPPGDPGPNVDIQDLVGGQPGRPDPGATGGPTHEELGIEPAPEERGVARVPEEARAAGVTGDRGVAPGKAAGGGGEGAPKGEKPGPLAEPEPWRKEHRTEAGKRAGPEG
jgi:hypothetical protein